jgi:Right handed beta helix region
MNAKFVMKTNHHIILAAGVCGLVLSVQSGFAQGSLTPPGAPAPTMITLSQIEPRTPISSLPYTVTNPGSYYVTTNLTGAIGNDGIDIKTNDVTLDLDGFTLQGVAGSGAGINVLNPATNLVIRNGVLDSWGGNGVNATNGYNSQFERLRESNSGGAGLATGSNCVVLVCSVSANGGNGIEVGNSCAVKDCTANANGQGNNFGIEVGNNCIVKDCTACGNSTGGINVQGNDCLIAGNNCSGNGRITSANAIGISIGGVRNRIDNNNAGNNTYGPLLVFGPGIFPNAVNVNNCITRNFAPGGYGNTSGNNDYAPIQTPNTSTNPWANFQ